MIVLEQDPGLMTAGFAFLLSLHPKFILVVRMTECPKELHLSGSL